MVPCYFLKTRTNSLCRDKSPIISRCCFLIFMARKICDTSGLFPSLVFCYLLMRSKKSSETYNEARFSNVWKSPGCKCENKEKAASVQVVNRTVTFTLEVAGRFSNALCTKNWKSWFLFSRKLFFTLIFTCWINGIRRET